jgi:hypothetical protein
LRHPIYPFSTASGFAYGITNRHVRLATGYLGLTISWLEGIELNFSAAFFGPDVRRPP